MMLKYKKCKQKDMDNLKSNKYKEIMINKFFKIMRFNIRIVQKLC